MNMRRLLTLAAAVSAVALAGAAHASTAFNGDYTLTAINSSDPGLKVFATDLPGAINLNLNVGQTQTVALFNLWTDEGSVELKDDIFAKPISVLFNFTVPTAFSGAVEGDTFGIWGVVQSGKVVWDGPVNLHFGNGGVLQVSLNNATFNTGLFGLDEGPAEGATISGGFKLISDAVPEPATWAMMITGFGLAGASIRRRRATAVAA
jgi:hypothetical protein